MSTKLYHLCSPVIPYACVEVPCVAGICERSGLHPFIATEAGRAKGCKTLFPGLKLLNGLCTAAFATIFLQ